MASVADTASLAGAAKGASPAAGGRPRPGTALRFALREMRGGLKGFYVFIACIALGVGAIAGVGSLAGALGEGIAEEGQAILGGDASFTLIHREASEEERAGLEALGRVSAVATLRALARDPETLAQTLVEAKAVDRAYPLYGTLALASGRPLHAVIGEAPAGEGAPWPAVVDPSLLASQGIGTGDTFALGRITVEVADTIEAEPDKLSSGVGFGPRVMVSTDALAASGLVQPGSLVEWSYRVAGPDGTLSDAALERLVETAEARFPAAGWEIRTRQDAAPGLRNSIERFAQFLTLVGLTALLVGGVGVANAVRAYLQKKRATIASFRSLGASGGFVFRVYLFQVTALALLGIAIGILVGAAIPPLAGTFLAGILPVGQLFRVFPAELALAALYGLLTALTFALWPLGRAHDVPPTALFRDRETGRARPRLRYLLAVAAAGVVLVTLAVVLAYDPFIAGVYVVATAAAFVLLRAVGAGVMALARRAPRAPSAVVRLAVANIHRQGALTPTVVLSLGLSLSLLVTLALIDENLRNTLTSQLPERAPSFFFVDIQDREKDAFVSFLDAEAPDASVEVQPMLRGRIVSIDGVAAADWPAGEADWVLRGDRGITYSATVPPGSVVTEGAWWQGEGGDTPQVSFADELARELGLSVGDTVRVNVLGREIDTTVANFRTVEWESLSINFVMVFSPNTFRGAPHAHLATLTYPDGTDEEAREIALLKDLARDFPTVTAVRVKQALEAVNDVVSDLVLAIRAAAGVTLFASVLVLAGTLAASHRGRIYDAVILKTLGATRARIVAAFALEYALLGLATALFAILAGSVAAYFVLEELMQVDFAMLPGAVVGAVVGALVVTVGLGLVGTWRALGEKPAPVLRAL